MTSLDFLKIVFISATLFPCIYNDKQSKPFCMLCNGFSDFISLSKNSLFFCTTQTTHTSCDCLLLLDQSQLWTNEVPAPRFATSVPSLFQYHAVALFCLQEGRTTLRQTLWGLERNLRHAFLLVRPQAVSPVNWSIRDAPTCVAIPGRRQWTHCPCQPREATACVCIPRTTRHY